MAIRNKRIPISVVEGEGKRSLAYNYFYNSLGQSCCVEELSPPPQGYAYEIQPSDINAIFNKLMELVNTGNSEEFQKLLQLDFVLSAEGSSYHQTNNGFNWSNEHGKCVSVRPHIEQLFVADIARFEMLIDALIDKNDPKMYEAFRSSLLNTDLDHPNLFEWNVEMQTKAEAELKNVIIYGNLLKQDSRAPVRDKGELAVELGYRVTAFIRNRNVPPVEKDVDKFQNLKFKIQMVRELHQHDAKFNIHRGWKRFIANLLSILLTGGIANYVKSKMSDSSLFFNQTTTQSNVNKTQETLGVNRMMIPGA